MPTTFFDPNLRAWLATLFLVGLALIQVGVVVRVIMRRRPVGESLAWVFIVALAPAIGPLVYLLVGELRVGAKRAHRLRSLADPIGAWIATLPGHGEGWADAPWAPFAALAQKTLLVPPQGGARLELLGDWQHAFDRLVEDIDATRSTCHLEFYIWADGGRADDVAAALTRAAKRGVACRVLLDAIGSRPFLNGPTAAALRDAGVRVVAAMPGGIVRAAFVRFDLRMHRKLAVLDGRVAYTGSMNVVDPRTFKQSAGVGQWVDAMARVEGPAVQAMAITFLADWHAEAGEPLEALRVQGDALPRPDAGDALVQVIPSGPAYRANAIERALVSAVYAARKELILTTPYFVPDESLQVALVVAAQRGVEVTLVMPRRVDSLLVRLASGALLDELLEAGVRVYRFDDGLLHTKSVTVDGSWSLFGSLNLDPRSLHLNFEMTLGVYDAPFTQALRKLQLGYVSKSVPMDLRDWTRRSPGRAFLENLARLLGPLL